MTSDGYTFLARDLEDGEVALPAPLEFELVWSFDSPAHSFEGVFPCARGYDDLYSLEVRRAGALIFSGQLDETTIRQNDGGAQLRLLARSRGAVLLDNEALPQTHLDVSLDDMFRDHVRPYGIEGMRTDVGQDAFLNEYQILKGTSEWEAFYNFFRLTGLGIAYFDAEDRLVCMNQEPYGAVHRFSNRRADALHFSDLKLTDNRYSPISRFLIRDRDGVYSYGYTNSRAAALRIQRKRYLIPSPSFSGSATGGQIDASILVRRSMLGKRVVTLTAPGLLDIRRRDLVDLETDFGQYDGLFVYQVRHRRAAAGETTTLSLLDKNFI